ncbi:glycosyltransferase [Pedobacter sp. MC2016-14]|uniref:glycosyltransferase family 2 protein n=1 Tax=Pedobacter sp. MC2016-14 TaxID=2897327 RepID=UPI001E3794A6|nr:glycosyltransferase [Pedobacter sp. MC2016-14]MCD0486950.1 glycosyltransferase [Pedobacter sp. MC2016-14]
MVSAIILSYNRRDEVLYTVEKLKALRRNLAFPLEIIVVDNASADDTSLKIAQSHPDITLITKELNNGIAGWNEGFKVATYQYLLVLDDDSHIESGLAEAVSYLEQSPSFGILALNITGGSYETGDWPEHTDIIGFIGCGALIRKEVYEKIGGFAAWMHVYGHEWEYGIRVIDAGYKIRYFKSSSIIHRTSALNRTNKRLRMYSTRNEMGIVYKHFRNNRLKYILRVWLNSMKVIKKEGFMAAFYCFMGGFKFLQLKSRLPHTPVSQQTQDFFANMFWGTQPSFDFIKKGFGISTARKEDKV